jgi:hypothetical protein
VQFGFDDAHHISDVSEVGDLVIRQFEVQRILQVHDQRHGLERAETQVVDQLGVESDLRRQLSRVEDQ